MPWKKDFTLSDEMSPSGIVWPAGKAAVSVVVDYSVPAGAEGIDEAAIAYARTVWGNAVSGDWLIELSERLRREGHVRRAAGDGPGLSRERPPRPCGRPRNRRRSFAKEDVAGLSPTKNGNALSGRFRGLRS